MTEPLKRKRAIVTAGKWIAGQALTGLVGYMLNHATGGHGKELLKAALRWWLHIHI